MAFDWEKSTVRVVLTSFILDSFDVKKQVDIIFTDFKQVFDTIDHGLLVREFGIGNPLLS